MATFPGPRDSHGLVQLANDMLAQLHASTQVRSVSGITAAVFVTLFEGLCGEPLQDVIRRPQCTEDEVHNCQCVIDALSLDILNTSLSHIAGQDVVSGDPEAVGDLLEVFSGLLDYILDKISSAASTDNEDDKGSDLPGLDDPDMLTSEVIDDILEKELGASYKSINGRGSKDDSRYRSLPDSLRRGGAPVRNLNSTSELVALGQTSRDYSGIGDDITDKTSELIALGDSARYPGYSPPRKGPSEQRDTQRHRQDAAHSGTNDSQNTAELIREGESLERRLGLGADVSVSARPDASVSSRSAAISNGGYRHGDGGASTSTRASAVPCASIEISGMPTLSMHISDIPSMPVRNNGKPSTAIPSSSIPSTSLHSSGMPASLANSSGVPSTVGHRSGISSTVGHRSGIPSTVGHGNGSDIPSRSARINGVPPTSALAQNTRIQPSSSYGNSVRSAEVYNQSVPSSAAAASTTAPAKVSLTAAPKSDALTNASMKGPSGREELDYRQKDDRTKAPTSRGSGAIATSYAGRVTATVSGPVATSAAGKDTAREASPHTVNSVADSSVLSSISYPHQPSLPSDSGTEGTGSADEFASLGVRPRVDPLSSSLPVDSGRGANGEHHVFTHHLYHHYDRASAGSRDPLSSSLPLSAALATSRDATRGPVSAASSLRTTDSSGGGAPSSGPGSRHVTPATSTHPSSSAHGANHRPARAGHHRTQVNGSKIQGILSPARKNGDKSRKNVSFKGRPTSDEARTDTARTNASQSSSLSGSVNLAPGRGGLSKQHDGAHAPMRDMIGNFRRSAVDLIPGAARKVAPSSGEALRPSTYEEYRRKYYPDGGSARLLRRSVSDEDVSYLAGATRGSSSASTSGDALSSRGVEASDLDVELEAFRRKLEKKSKSVRFEDILDDSAPGHMGPIRRKLKHEDQQSRLKKEFLDQIYQDELTDFQAEMEDRLQRQREKAKDLEKEFKKKAFRQPKTNKTAHGSKYSVPVSVLMPRGRVARSRTRSVRGRKGSMSASPIRTEAPVSIYDNEILPWLLEEFPFLHLSKETLQDLWRKSARQIQQLSVAEKEVRRKKSKAQIQVEDADKRQRVLMDIMKKELTHNQRMRETKERQKQQQAVRSQVSNKRQQSARARKYYSEYQVRMRSKMLKKRSKEEMVFKHLFKEGLDIQKERIRDLRRYAKEQRSSRASKQQDELESMENYYKDRFAMLAETLAQERRELDTREKSQTKVVGQMQKELRRKLEHEVQDFQEQLYRDEDDAYWRQLDADRLRVQLHMARYQAKV